MNLQTLLRRCLLIALSSAALLALVSCGGDNSGSANEPPVSGFASRVYVINSFTASIIIMNAADDTVFPVPIRSIPTNADKMAESEDKRITLVGSSSNNTFAAVDNSTETVSASFTLPSFTESFSVLSDNKTGIVAVRNAPVTGQPNGGVLLLDLTNSSITATISVPLVRYLSLNQARTKVLAFAENSDSVYVIDPTAKTATAVPGFDRPVAAVFVDDTKAYVLNCGAECGGTTASVTLFDTSNNSLGANIPVPGATVGLIDSGKLYVAGTANNIGQLSVIDTATNTLSRAGIAISNGYHSTMGMASGSNLYIGAKNCTNQSEGCLSIYPAGASQAILSPTKGSVFGIQPISSRNVVYVSIGGELVIYDTNTNAPRPDRQLDIVGFAGDVLQIN